MNKYRIIEQFIKDTPTWLASLNVWDDGTGCKMCGAKYNKFKELHEALVQLNLPTQKEN